MNFKQAKATTVYAILGFLPLATSILLFPLNARYLTPEDYGIASKALIAQTIIGVLILFGLDGIVNRFYLNFDHSHEAKRNFLGYLILQILLYSLVFLIIFLILGEYIFEASFQYSVPFDKYGWYIFFSSFFSSISVLFIIYFRADENIPMVAASSIFPFVGSIAGAVVGIVILRLGVFGNIAGKAIGGAIGVVPFIIYLTLKVKLKFHAQTFYALLSVGVYACLFSLLSNVNLLIDRLIMGIHFSETDLGIYTVATTIVSPISIGMWAYWSSINPEVFRQLRTFQNPNKIEEKNGAEKSIQIAYTNLFILTCILYYGAVLISSPVLRIITSQAYWSASYYVPILAFAFLPRCASMICSTEVLYAKNTRLIAIAGLVSLLLSIAFSILTISVFGKIAIASSTIINHLIFCLSIFLIFKQKYNVDVLDKSFFCVSIFSLLWTANYYFVLVPCTGEIWAGVIFGLTGWCVLFFVYRHTITLLAQKILNRLKRN